MNLLKILAVLFVVFFGLATTNSFAQSITTVKQRSKINANTPIFNKLTGAQITREEFRAIIQENPRAHFVKEIDERGEITTLIYDPEGNGKTTRDPNLRTKPNQAFPNFIFTSTTNERINLRDLRGKIVILYFNMALKEPFSTQQKFTDFENLLEASSDKNDIKPFIITHSDTAEIEDFIKKVRVPYPIVINSINFFDKYIIIKTPSFIVIKKDGTLGAYADNLDELKQVISKLK